MNGAYLHLVTNHFPIITTALTLVFFVLNFLFKKQWLVQAALLLAVLSGVFSLPAYFSGEPAETVVMSVRESAKLLIESHEEAAETAMIVSIITAILSAVLLFVKNSKINQYRDLITKVVMILILASSGLFVWTAKLAGKISHPEAQTDKQVTK